CQVMCAFAGAVVFIRECCASRPLFFFFSSRRRHTRFKCDWSSDVCSSDLPYPFFPRGKNGYGHQCAARGSFEELTRCDKPGRLRSEERRVGKECRSRWWQ